MSGKPKSSTTQSKRFCSKCGQRVRRRAHGGRHHVAIANQFDDVLPLHRHVFNDEQFLDRTIDEFDGLREGVFERFFCNRFLQKGNRASRKLRSRSSSTVTM